MVLHGRIEHGAVVLTDKVSLPDGAEVTVIIQPQSGSAALEQKLRVSLPLVSSNQSGSRKLTAERVSEILDDDDLSG